MCITSEIPKYICLYTYATRRKALQTRPTPTESGQGHQSLVPKLTTLYPSYNNLRVHFISPSLPWKEKDIPLFSKSLGTNLITYKLNKSLLNRQQMYVCACRRYSLFPPPLFTYLRHSIN